MILQQTVLLKRKNKYKIIAAVDRVVTTRDESSDKVSHFEPVRFFCYYHYYSHNIPSHGLNRFPSKPPRWPGRTGSALISRFFFFFVHYIPFASIIYSDPFERLSPFKSSSHALYDNILQTTYCSSRARMCRRGRSLAYSGKVEMTTTPGAAAIWQRNVIYRSHARAYTK